MMKGTNRSNYKRIKRVCNLRQKRIFAARNMRP